jgi:phage portal protein BeeE
VANLLSRFRGGPPGDGERYSLEQYVHDVAYAGNVYQPALPTTYADQPVESIETDFVGVVGGAYKRNGIVFACQTARLSVFSQATFCWQRQRGGKPGDTFTSAALRPVQEPWVGGSEGELLARMIQDVDNAGNAYIRRRPPTAMSMNNLERLRPDLVDIVLAAEPQMMNHTVIGYLYHRGGRTSGQNPEVLTLDEVAHWSPYPDPLATYRGMAPITPVLREVVGDNAATTHKGEFFNRAATPNMAIKFDPSVTVEKFEKFKAAMEREHVGVGNAWKTLYLGGGADPVTVGHSFKDMDYKAVQGLGETRIAAAYGVPAVIAQISEGLAGSSLNAGNFSAARRLFADRTMRWLWKEACASLQRILTTPPGTRLWWDERQVAFLREDQKDAAEIQSTRAQTITALVREGFTADSVITAVQNEDFTLLEHSGALSVQLVAPGDQPGGASADTPDDQSGSSSDDSE